MRLHVVDKEKHTFSFSSFNCSFFFFFLFFYFFFFFFFYYFFCGTFIRFWSYPPPLPVVRDN